MGEYQEVLTKKLLLLPQEEKYNELKRCLRRAFKADGSNNKEESTMYYMSAEDELELLLHARKPHAALRGIMGVVRKRLRGEVLTAADTDDSAVAAASGGGGAAAGGGGGGSGSGGAAGGARTPEVARKEEVMDASQAPRAAAADDASATAFGGAGQGAAAAGASKGERKKKKKKKEAAPSVDDKEAERLEHMRRRAAMQTVDSDEEDASPLSGGSSGNRSNLSRRHSSADLDKVRAEQSEGASSAPSKPGKLKKSASSIDFGKDMQNEADGETKKKRRVSMKGIKKGMKRMSSGQLPRRKKSSADVVVDAAALAAASKEKSSKKKKSDSKLSKSPSMQAMSDEADDDGDATASALFVMKRPRMSDHEIEETFQWALYCIFLPLNREVDFFPQKLLEVVRRGLGIDDDALYDQFINSILDTCNFECLLTQLSSQINLLSSHPPPYYVQSLFESKELFEQWQRGEQARIETMIALVEQDNPGLKRSKSYKYKPPRCGHHRLYQLLGRSLYYAQGRKLAQRSLEESDVTETCLTEASRWLLEEYGERYGVNALYRRIDLLDIVLTPYRYDLDGLVFASQALGDITQLLERGTPITSNEKTTLKEVLEKVVDGVTQEIGHVLTKYDAFSNYNHLKIALECIPAGNRVRSCIGMAAVDLRPIVTAGLRAAATDKYKALVRKAAESAGDKDPSVPISAQQFSITCDLIMASLGDIENFHSFFEEWANLTALFIEQSSIDMYKDIQAFCKEHGMKSKPTAVLNLALRLQEHNECFDGKVPDFQPIPLSSCFGKFVPIWIDQSKKKFEEWIKNAVDNETWDMVDEDKDYSSSVVDAFCMITQPYGFIKSQLYLQSPSSGGATILQQYAKSVIADAVIRYADVVYEDFIEDFPLNTKGGKERLRALFNQHKDLPGTTYFLREDVVSEQPVADPSESPRSKKAISKKDINKKTRGDADIEPELCIRANSVRRALELVEIIDEKYGHELEFDFGPAKVYVARTVRLFVMMIVYWMNIKMHEEMQYFIKKKKVDGVKIEDTDDLLFYMDSQLGIIARCLNPKLFSQELLPGLWKAAIFDIRKILKDQIAAKKKLKMSSGSFQRANRCLQDLFKYFNAGGQGIPLETLTDDTTQIFQDILK